MRKIFLFIICSIAFSGCVNTLDNVRHELKQGGFALWYPAEGGIEPGQIWRTDGAKKDIYQRRPKDLKLDPEQPAIFQTLTKKIDAKIALSADFLGNSAFSALLKKGTVRDIKLDLGNTTISRLVIGDLSRFKTNTEYGKCLKLVREGKQNMVLITAVLKTSGMSYEFTCQDTDQLKLQANKIKELVNADFTIDIENKKVARWKIPKNKTLVIGISPERGEFMVMDDKKKDIKTKTIDRMEKWQAFSKSLIEVKAMSLPVVDQNHVKVLLDDGSKITVAE